MHFVPALRAAAPRSVSCPVFISHPSETTIPSCCKKRNPWRLWPATPHSCQSTTCICSLHFLTNSSSSDASLILLECDWRFLSHMENSWLWFHQPCGYSNTWSNTCCVYCHALCSEAQRVKTHQFNSFVVQSVWNRKWRCSQSTSSRLRWSHVMSLWSRH